MKLSMWLLCFFCVMFVPTGQRKFNFRKVSVLQLQFVLLGFCLKCYSDVHSQEMELCEERKGFRTCFIKYDHGKKTYYWWIKVVCLFHNFYYVTIYPVSNSKEKLFRWICNWTRLCHPGTVVRRWLGWDKNLCLGRTN